MWEDALRLCRILQFQYENVLFDYEKLSDLLNRMAELYRKIIKVDQQRGPVPFFKIVFSGQKFPSSIRGKVRWGLVSFTVTEFFS